MMADSAGRADAPMAEASRLRIGILRLARRLRNERADDSMSDSQLAVLRALKVYGAHTLGELAARERVSSPSMNRTVNCLERSGHVSRVPDSRDRRKVNIALTEAGVVVIAETHRRRDAWLEDALAELDEDDRRTLLNAVDVMTKLAQR